MTNRMTTTNRFDDGRGRRWPLLLALAGFALGGAGACDRGHLSSYYGTSFNTWFAMQHARSTPADSESTKRALTSLDAQEATTVSKSYRRAFGGGQDSSGPQQMVMVGQGPRANESYTPPPSVPGQ
jgi:hypothetical protein